MAQSLELSLVLSTVAARVVSVVRPTPLQLASVEESTPRRVMFASGVIRKRRGEPLRWA